MEDLQLKDFVDFTTTIQKFEQVAVEGNHLVLTDFKGKKHTQKINSKTELIKDLIDKSYNQKPLQEISLHDLKYTCNRQTGTSCNQNILIFSFCIFHYTHKKNRHRTGTKYKNAMP